MPANPNSTTREARTTIDDMRKSTMPHGWNLRHEGGMISYLEACVGSRWAPNTRDSELSETN